MLAWSLIVEPLFFLFVQVPVGILGLLAGLFF